MLCQSLVSESIFFIPNCWIRGECAWSGWVNGTNTARVRCRPYTYLVQLPADVAWRVGYGRAIDRYKRSHRARNLKISICTWASMVGTHKRLTDKWLRYGATKRHAAYTHGHRFTPTKNKIFSNQTIYQARAVRGITDDAKETSQNRKRRKTLDWVKSWERIGWDGAARVQYVIHYRSRRWPPNGINDGLMYREWHARRNIYLILV